MPPGMDRRRSHDAGSLGVFHDRVRTPLRWRAPSAGARSERHELRLGWRVARQVNRPVVGTRFGDAGKGRHAGMPAHIRLGLHGRQRHPPDGIRINRAHAVSQGQTEKEDGGGEQDAHQSMRNLPNERGSGL